jgi:hypothetical protein
MDRKKYANVSVSNEAMKLLQEMQKELQDKLGMKLSFGQVISYLVKHRSK